MSEKFIPVKMDLQQFLAGQNPVTPTTPEYIDTITDLQGQCVLHGDAPFQVQCALICDHTEIGGRNFDSVTGAMMHVFNMKDHSSRLFTIDAKDGKVDWNALRNTIQRHTQAPHAARTYWENTNGVSETDIHRPSTLTRRVAEALVSQMTNYTVQERRAFLEDVEKQHASSTAPSERDRMFGAIMGALRSLPERGGKLDTMAAYQAATMATDPVKQTEIMLSGITDAHACTMREQWTAGYARMQAQGLSPHQAGALAMVHTLSNHIEYYHRFNGPSDTYSMTENDYAECAFARAEAIEMARAAGCSEYDIGKARNPVLTAEIDVFGISSPTDSYLHYASNIYAMSFSNENQAIAAAIFHDVLVNAPGSTPNEKIQYTIEHAKEAVQKATGETPPTFEVFSEKVAQIRGDTTLWSVYSALHSGDLTPAVAEQLQKAFVDKMFEVGASRSLNNHTSLAIAMHKAAQDVRQSPEVQNEPNMRYAMAKISSGTIIELSNAGMTTEQMHDALDDRDDVGDDAI